MSTAGLERNGWLGRLAFNSSANTQCKFLPQPSSVSPDSNCLYIQLVSADRSLNMKDLIAPACVSPLASNPHLTNAFTRQCEVLQSPLWVGNLL